MGRIREECVAFRAPYNNDAPQICGQTGEPSKEFRPFLKRKKLGVNSRLNLLHCQQYRLYLTLFVPVDSGTGNHTQAYVN